MHDHLRRIEQPRYLTKIVIHAFHTLEHLGMQYCVLKRYRRTGRRPFEMNVQEARQVRIFVGGDLEGADCVVQHRGSGQNLLDIGQEDLRTVKRHARIVAAVDKREREMAGPRCEVRQAYAMCGHSPGTRPDICNVIEELLQLVDMVKYCREVTIRLNFVEQLNIDFENFCNFLCERGGNRPMPFLPFGSQYVTYARHGTPPKLQSQILFSADRHFFQLRDQISPPPLLGRQLKILDRPACVECGILSNPRSFVLCRLFL